MNSHSESRIMRIAFFEDAGVAGLAPIALLRPAHELLCGQFTMRQRWRRALSLQGQRDVSWSAFVRPYLADCYRERQPDFRVNDYTDLTSGPTLLINSRWLGDPASVLDLDIDTAAVVNDTVVALWLDPLEAALLAEDAWDDALQSMLRRRTVVTAEDAIIHHPWHLVTRNPSQLKQDFRYRAGEESATATGQQVSVMGSTDDIWIHPTAELHPFVVLDSRQGPITIDADAMVQSFTCIQGPCHIGRGAQLFRAHVKDGSTIGPVCRVGGEVEASIMHGYANKYHEGFLGHSYVCPWVNLGALSTNSDLKSDYSPVRVPLTGEVFDTGETKVGCFIGDHTKTAIGSLFNTGSSIGVMCVVLPGGELLPKHIPSFARIWHGKLQEGWDLTRDLDTARVAMSRRGVELTTAEERMIRHLQRVTWAERDAALNRSRERELLKRAQLPA